MVGGGDEAATGMDSGFVTNCGWERAVGKQKMREFIWSHGEQAKGDNIVYSDVLVGRRCSIFTYVGEKVWRTTRKAQSHPLSPQRWRQAGRQAGRQASEKVGKPNWPSWASSWIRRPKFLLVCTC
jgi:hypothetical protein